MDNDQKYVSDLLAVFQHWSDETRNGFRKRILKRLIAVVEGYIVEDHKNIKP